MESTNTTDAGSHGASSDFIVVPIFLGTFLYLSLVVAAWPFAARRIPFLWLALLALIPPLFPFALLILFFQCCDGDVARPTAPVIVINPDVRGRVRTFPGKAQRGF